MRWRLPWSTRADQAGLAVEAGDSGADGSDAILQRLADGILVLSGQRIVFANAAAQDLLGRNLTGQDVRLVLRHPDAAALLASEREGTIEYATSAEGGRRLELRVAMLGEGRRMVQVADRSARHLAERARTDFVANASHELRTPLATIRGYTETLLDDEAGGDAATRGNFLRTMDREARRMERLIDDLMSLSRIEADKFVRPDAVVAVDGLLKQVVAEIVAAHPDFAAHIRFEAGDGCDVQGDAAQLSQLAHNLIDNARRYGGKGMVEATARRIDDSVVLSVADQGPGIPAKHIPRLTERFYRVDAARSRFGGGTGLGLAIVKHIVDRHRGTLEIASVVDTGTTVTIRLPALRIADVTGVSHS